jgi:aminopeptidase N
MTADLSSYAHPLKIPKHYGRNRFDDISYQKGSSILHMIGAYLGEKRLISRVRDYLATHQFGTAETEDFFNSLGKGAWDIWKVWANNAGHPYLLVNETDRGEIHFTQVHRVGDSEGDAVFPIPLLIKTETGVDKAAMVIAKTGRLTVNVGESDFFCLNADGAGFYRVGYISERLRKLAAESHKLTPADMTGMVSDTYTLASENIQLDASDVLTLISGLMDTNDNYWVWKASYDAIRSLKAVWRADTGIDEALTRLSLNKTAARIDRLGWPQNYWRAAQQNIDIGEDDLSVRFKAMTLYEGALAGDEAAIEASKEIARTLFKSGMAAAGGNAWQPALEIAIQHGGEEEVRRPDYRPTCYFGKALQYFSVQ